MNFGGGSLPDNDMTERMGKITDPGMTVPSMPVAEALDGATVPSMAAVSSPTGPMEPIMAPAIAAAAIAPAPAPVPVVAPAPVVAQRVEVAPAPAPKPAAQTVKLAPASSAKPAGGKKAGFRETAWFKKGELEEEMAKRAADDGSDPLAGPSTPAVGDVDPATLTADDRARLSLKTGRTEMMAAIKTSALPGERMSEADLLAEVDSSKKWMVWAGIGVVVVAVVVAVVYFVFMSGPARPKAALPTPVLPVATAPPAPEPPKKDPPPAPPPKKTPSELIELAKKALKDGNVASPEGSCAVDLLVLAKGADPKGKDAKEFKKVEIAVAKSLQSTAKVAAKKKKRAVEAEALAGLVKLHPGDKGTKARLAKLQK
jgi:hypothetical protein